MINANETLRILPQQNNSQFILELIPGYACRGAVTVIGILEGNVVVEKQLNLEQVKDKFVHQFQELTSLKDATIAVRGSMIPLAGKTNIGLTMNLILDQAMVFSRFIDEMDFVVIVQPQILKPEVET